MLQSHLQNQKDDHATDVVHPAISEMLSALKKGLACSNCSKVGHIARVCKSAKKHTQPAAIKAFQVSNIEEEEFDELPKVTPRLPILILNKNMERHKRFLPFPDTGGASSVISHDLAMELGMHIIPRRQNEANFSTVNGQVLKVIGKVHAKISVATRKENFWEKINIIVSPEIS